MNKLIWLLLTLSCLTYSAELRRPQPIPIYLVYSFRPNNNQPRARDVVSEQEFTEHIDSIIDYISNVVYDFAENKYYIEFLYY